jgi:hypothetical protein
MRRDAAAEIDRAALVGLWQAARAQLRAQLDQRVAQAVFLEGSLAEGFGNTRSDVDFVALVDDGTKVATMPYILFIHDRRVEVRLLSRARISRELAALAGELQAGLTAPSTRIGWNTLERCQRFMHCLPMENAPYVAELQATLGLPALGRIVEAWFRDFAQQAARHAVAMHALAQPDAARAWLKTAVFHAGKSFVAGRGEHYLGSKWLALQMDRCEVDRDLQRRVRGLLFDPAPRPPGDAHMARGIALLGELGVDGVALDPALVLVERTPQVTTWQIGRNLHVVRGADVFRLGRPAANAWRAVVFGTSCEAVATDGHTSPELALQRKGYLADFARKGLVALAWADGERIRAGISAESPAAAPCHGAVISMDGARLAQEAAGDVQLLPLPAIRFAEAGVNLTWANIGVENAREDSLGALARQQWGVLEYTLQRMVQAASLVAIAAHGITPQPPLEEATLVARRLLALPPGVADRIATLESVAIASEAEARRHLDMAEEATRALRAMAGEAHFPASFDHADGWCETILYGYDWFNLAAHLDAPFPASATGGRGSAEEARDLLASNLT